MAGEILWQSSYAGKWKGRQLPSDSTETHQHTEYLKAVAGYWLNLSLPYSATNLI